VTPLLRQPRIVDHQNRVHRVPNNGGYKVMQLIMDRTRTGGCRIKGWVWGCVQIHGAAKVCRLAFESPTDSRIVGRVMTRSAERAEASAWSNQTAAVEPRRPRPNTASGKSTSFAEAGTH
jgi:hypothetical protein